MPDGSIVLRVVSRTDQQVTHTLWKVHKSVLSYHSPFFCELFEGPGGSTLIDKASEQYGDVPLMDMQDDAKDMGDFLKALYSPGIAFEYQSHCMSLIAVGTQRNFSNIIILALSAVVLP